MESAGAYPIHRTQREAIVVTLEQIAILIGSALLGLFILAGYLAPTGILLGKWIKARGWQPEYTESTRVSLLSIWESWRTAFSYMFVFQTMTMTLAWTLDKVTPSHSYWQISKIAAVNLGLAAPFALVLSYAILEGANGTMVSWDFYQELKRREKARREAEIEERIGAEVQERLATEIAVRREAEIEERVEAEGEARVKSELERLRNGNVE